MDSSTNPNATTPGSNSSGGGGSSSSIRRISGLRFYEMFNPEVRGGIYTFVMDEAQAERLNMATHVQNGLIDLFNDKPPSMIRALSDVESDKAWKRLGPDPIRVLADRGIHVNKEDETEKKMEDEIKTSEEVVKQYPRPPAEDDDSGSGTPPAVAGN